MNQGCASRLYNPKALNSKPTPYASLDSKPKAPKPKDLVEVGSKIHPKGPST